ncbi:hypothetical protein, partial [Hydrogenophaga sp.]|uniref:hypothetical protein n=1 Tax=Hydrogenophaga sp. TaxID=1904254 RepID=UPI002730468F
MKARESRVHFHAGGSEGLRTSQANAKACRLFGIDIRNFDFRSQRLPKRRLHNNTAQRQCVGGAMVRERGTQQSSCGYCLQATKPGDLSHLARRLNGGRAGFEWHLDLEGKNLFLTLTSTDYGDKLRIRLSFPAHRLSCWALEFTLLTCNEPFQLFPSPTFIAPTRPRSGVQQNAQHAAQ